MDCPRQAQPAVVIVNSTAIAQSDLKKNSSIPVMETAQVTEVQPQPVDVVEPVINDKLTENATEVVATHPDNNNNDHAESSNPADSVKAAEPELVPTEENRPADIPVTARTNNGGDTTPAVVPKRPASSPHLSHASEGGAEVVTPAGTVEAPLCASNPPIEVVEKEAAVPAVIASEPAPVDPIVEADTKATEPSVEETVEQNHVEHKTEPAIERAVEQREVVTPVVSAPVVSEVASIPEPATTVTTSTVESIPTEAPAPSPGKKAKKQVRKAHLSFAS